MAFKISIGDGLLNETSKELAVSHNEKIVHLDPSLIDVNELNAEMSMDGLEELQESIEKAGILQPLLVVLQESKRYKLLAGHRRLLAFTRAIEAGTIPVDSKVKCIIKDVASVRFNISNVLKEKYILASTNTEVRIMNVQNQLVMLDMLEDVYNAAQQSGEKIVGRKRDWLAKQAGTSTSQVQRMNFINKNLIDEFKNIKELPITLAVSLAQLPKEKQREVLKDYPVTQLTPQYIDDIKEALADEIRIERTVKKEKKEQEEQVFYSFICNTLCKYKAVDDPATLVLHCRECPVKVRKN